MLQRFEGFAPALSGAADLTLQSGGSLLLAYRSPVHLG
jgi:hypothetical protein